MLKFYGGITNFTNPPSLIKNEWSLSLKRREVKSCNYSFGKFLCFQLSKILPRKNWALYLRYLSIKLVIVIQCVSKKR